MIFVTVGWQYGFKRLITKMDEIASRINEEVVMQIGTTEYEPKYAKYFHFVESDDQVLEYIRESRLVISHAGAGSILTVFSIGRPTIIVPRLRKYGEHIDDHQLELAEAMSREGQVIVVYDINDLDGHVQKDGLDRPMLIRNCQLVNNLKQLIDSLL